MKSVRRARASQATEPAVSAGRARASRRRATKRCRNPALIKVAVAAAVGRRQRPPPPPPPERQPLESFRSREARKRKKAKTSRAQRTSREVSSVSRPRQPMTRRERYWNVGYVPTALATEPIHIIEQPAEGWVGTKGLPQARAR